MVLNRGDFVFLGTQATAHNPLDHCTLKGTTGISWVETTYVSKRPIIHKRLENALAPNARVADRTKDDPIPPTDRLRVQSHFHDKLTQSRVSTSPLLPSDP